MEVIVAVVEVPPGNELPRHTHHGEEAVYVLEGATLSLPDGKEVPFPTGTVSINKRDVPHAGFKIAGDKTLKNDDRPHRRQGQAAHQACALT